VSQPHQPPGDGTTQPPQQPPVQPQEVPQQRQPVVVHSNSDGQLAHQFAQFQTEMSNTLRGLPEQLVNAFRESSPQQQPPATTPPAQQQTAQQSQTQQHTQQPPAQQAQQTATERAPLRTRFQNAWFGTRS
jgi:hypothetical protein